MGNLKFTQLQDKIFNLDFTETTNTEWQTSPFKAFYKRVVKMDNGSDCRGDIWWTTVRLHV